MSNPNAVLISNVDDYLAPSQACINPLYNSSNDKQKEEEKTEEKEKATDAAAANVVVPKARRRRPRVTPSDGEGPVIPSVAESPKKVDPIKASMADCLACSGCVTTAETVLLEQNHSLTALKNAMLLAQHKTMVATISPAVWADLLRTLQVPQTEKQVWQQKLVTALQRVLNVSYVMDGNIPLQWSLLESGEEFCRAYLAKQNQKQQNQQQQQFSNVVEELEENQTPSVAINSAETQYMLPDGNTSIVNTQQTMTQTQLPLLTSSCPALVCLVEKSTHGAVRHLSKTKSPMSMAGAWWRHHQHSSEDIFHLAIMPCHDKKLEASRKDFANSFNQQQQDVDIVLTTQEWLQMMAEFLQQGAENNNSTTEEGWSKDQATQAVREYVASLPPSPIVTGSYNNLLPDSNGNNGQATLLTVPQLDSTNTDDDAMDVEETNGDTMVTEKVDSINITNNGPPTTFTPYGSGGLAEFVFRYAAWKLFNYNVGEVEWKPVVDRSIKAASARMQRVARNRDYYQATLYQHASGEVSTEESEGSMPVLKFGMAYGLQTVQRALEPFSKSNKDNPFDFIEAMACPSGCLNGGGQLRVADRETPTQTRQRVSSTRDYFAALPTTESSMMQQALPPELRQTRFHVVPPLVFSMGAVKGVDVKDTQW